ncbi:MAG: hypothetical protein SGPRY_008160 [Prymnesium sp.]
MGGRMQLVLGLAAIVTGCFSSALGFQLMKLSSVVEVGLPLYRAPCWLAGFFLLAVVQTLADALSLSFLPLSVVAPFAGLTICFTLALASSGWFREAEELSRTDLLGALCVLVGVACVSGFAPHPAEEQTVDELEVAAAQFAVPLIAILVAVGGCLSASFSGRPLHLILAATGAASCGALSQTFLKLVSLEAKDSLGGGSFFEDPTLILSLTGLLFTAPSQLRLLTAALAVARASLAVPLYQSSLIVFTTAIGGIAFHEFAGAHGLSLAGYCGGLLMATIGLILLSMTSEDLVSPEDESESELKAAAAAGEYTTKYNSMRASRFSCVSRMKRDSAIVRIVTPAVSGVGLAVMETQNERELAERGRSKSVEEHKRFSLAKSMRARSAALL